MPADKELTKKITHRDIKKTVKSIATTQKNVCTSGDMWELAILCPGKKDTDKPELIGNFGTAMNGWTHESRKSTLKEVDWYIHAILKKNRVYQIVPVDFEGKHIKMSEKQKYKPFAYDIFSRPKPKNIGNYGGYPRFERSGSALRKATKWNPRNLPCPTCKKPNRLTPADAAKGYQCDECANRDEGCGCY